MKMKEEDKNEIFQSLYSLYDNFKKKDFDKTVYSKEFFKKMNETIIFSDNLQEMNKQLSIADFLKYSDLLFSKKIKQENKEEIEILQSEFSKLKSLFNKEKDKIKEMINAARDECVQLIKDEIKRCDDKKIDNIDEAKKNLQKNLDDKTQKIIKEEQNSRILIGTELNKITTQVVNNNISKEENSNITVNNEDKSVMPIKYAGLASALSVAIGAPLSVVVDGSLVTMYGGVYYGTTAYTITSLASSLTFVGLAIGIPFLAYMGYNYFHQTERYKESLKTLKASISDYFYDYLSRFEENFKEIEVDINKSKEGLLEIKNKNLDNVDENKWKKRKEEYSELRTDIINVIEFNNSKI